MNEKEWQTTAEEINKQYEAENEVKIKLFDFLIEQANKIIDCEKVPRDMKESAFAILPPALGEIWYHFKFNGEYDTSTLETVKKHVSMVTLANTMATAKDVRQIVKRILDMGEEK